MRQILTLVHEAERLPWPDKRDLGAPLRLSLASDRFRSGVSVSYKRILLRLCAVRRFSAACAPASSDRPEVLAMEAIPSSLFKHLSLEYLLRKRPWSCKLDIHAMLM